MADMRVAGERFAFDEDVWNEEVGRFDAAGKAQATAGESAGHRVRAHQPHPEARRPSSPRESSPPPGRSTPRGKSPPRAGGRRMRAT